MAEEPDGIDEAVEGLLRVGLTAAGRLSAERAAARAQLAPVDRAGWWDTARPDDIAMVWKTATTWRTLDPEAERAAGRIRHEVRERYGVDVDAPGADPAAVRAAIERRGLSEPLTAGPHDEARRDENDAARLLAAADRGQQSEQAGGDGAAVERYDSPKRRRQLAEALSAVADPEAVTARMLADVAQARPAEHAVAARPQPATRARRSGPPPPQRDRGSSFGR